MSGENAPTRESQVAIQCKRLESGLDDAHKNLAALEERLESVLTPYDEEAGESVPKEGLTPHADLLRRQADRAERLTEKLDLLHGRIEL